MIESHVWTSGGIAVIAAVLVTLAVACSDRWRQRLYPLFLLLLLGVRGRDGVGAWYGGEMVYREGIAVKLPYEQSEARRRDEPATPRRARLARRGDADGEARGRRLLRQPAADPRHARRRSPRRWGCSASGCRSARRRRRRTGRTPSSTAPASTALPNRQRGGAEDMAVLRSFAPQVEVTGEVERIPAARFWLLTFLVTVVASLAGWWVLGRRARNLPPAGPVEARHRPTATSAGWPTSIAAVADHRPAAVHGAARALRAAQPGDDRVVRAAAGAGAGGAGVARRAAAVRSAERRRYDEAWYRCRACTD